MSPDHAVVIAVVLVVLIALMWIGLAVECWVRSRQRSRLGPAETPPPAADAVEVGAVARRPVFSSNP